MCGISGLINQKGFSSKELVEMTHIVRHRGPDDEGYALWKNIDDEPAIFGGEDTPQDVFQSERDYLPQIRLLKSDAVNCCLAFGHRRLSIIDLSPNGHQPMSYLGNRYWIVLNGEIYNYIEIKEELHAKGYKFQSNTDTEVVMAAYHEWGVSCQQKFNGMWAFVIYDSKEKTIFISRDRFGIKPLYYWISPNCTFHFASEIKQFTVCEGWAASLNADMAYDYLLYSITDHTEETMFKGVFQILPGHYFFENINKMPASSGTSIDQKKWYQLPNETFVGDFSSAKMQFLQHFHSAIELHLRADVPV
ncbi:MAG TPA: hypothetical protein VLH16_02510, partial [Bacteroidales bacterium]|nr:hypothetical protein [Bacteroidales bacterium]